MPATTRWSRITALIGAVRPLQAVGQHVVERRIFPKFRDKLDRLGKFSGTAKSPAAAKKFVERELMFFVRCHAFGQRLNNFAAG